MKLENSLQVVYDFVENYGEVEISYIEDRFPRYMELYTILDTLTKKGILKKTESHNSMESKTWYSAISRLELINMPENETVNKTIDVSNRISNKVLFNETFVTCEDSHGDLISSVDVLDHGFVKYIDHMGNDLRTVNAARISFNKHKEVFDEKDAELIDYLMEHQHFGPGRHNYMTFHIKAPIFILRQWMRYKLGDFNEISSRYVNQEEADYFVPSEYRVQAKFNKQGSESSLTGEVQHICDDIYINAMEGAFYSYKALIDKGVCREQARCILPVGMYSEVYWTASLQSIAHFIFQREDVHAQKEIQDFAKAVKTIALQHFPKTLEAMLKNNP